MITVNHGINLESQSNVHVLCDQQVPARWGAELRESVRHMPTTSYSSICYLSTGARPANCSRSNRR